MNSVIIVGGGKSQRFNSEIPKQFINYNNKSIIEYSINTFLSNHKIFEVIIVIPRSWIVKFKNMYNQWYFSGQKTIVLKSENEESIFELQKNASIRNINNVIINDMGLTQVDNNSITTMAIGPYYEKDIDIITGHLKLL